MVLGKTRGHHAHLSLRLLHGHTAFQASHHEQPVKIVIDRFRLECQRHHQLRGEAVGRAGGHHADNRVRLAIYTELLTDDVSSRPQPLP